MSHQPLHATPARDTRDVAPSPGARRRLLNALDDLQGIRGVSATSPLVDANDAAKLLGVPSTWLLAQARARKVPHHKLGHYVRFDLDELIDWLGETRVAPGPQPRRR